MSEFEKPFGENPFNPGTPSRPEGFVGRKALIDSLRGAVFDTPDQALVSIYGQRRIGKTSLLRKLMHEWEAEVETHCLYCDGLSLQSQTPEDWFADLIELLEGPSIGSAHLTNPWERLEELISSSRRVIVFLDQFDALSIEHAPQFGTSFFDSLRALLTSPKVLGKLTLVTATLRGLDAFTWNPEIGPGSPFANISGHIEEIRLLTEEEARELLRHGESISLTPEEVDFLLRLAGPHPHFLHVAGSAVWHVRRTGVEDFEYAVRERFFLLSRPAYASILRGLSQQVRDGLYMQAALGTKRVERERDLRANLLVNNEGELLSEGLRSYCLGDERAIIGALHRGFHQLPRPLRELLAEHAISGEAVPEDAGYLLKEFGWLDTTFRIPRGVRLRFPQIEKG